MSKVGDVYSILKFDIKNEFNSLSSLLSLALYVCTVIYMIYFLLSTVGSMEVRYWSSIFWLVIVFSVINILVSHFSSFSENQRSYFYTVISPEGYIIGKIIFFILYSFILSIIAFLLYTLWLGNPVVSNIRFLITLILGVSNFSTLFAMTTSISVYTNNQTLISSILGFPLVIPLIRISTNLSKESFFITPSDNFLNHIMILIGYNVLLIALSIFLYPYIWRK